MADILAFPPKPADAELIRVCGNCDCFTFTLHADGTARCAHCGTPLVDSNTWIKIEPDAEQTQTSAGATEVVDFASSTASKDRTVEEIRKADDVVGLIFVRDDGYIGTWGRDARGLTPERRQWTADRFARGLTTLLMPELDNHGPADT